MLRRKIVKALLTSLVVFSLLLVGGKSAEANSSVQFIIGQKYYLDSGSMINTDVAPYIRSGRTMVPVAFVAKALGADSVKWEQATQTVVILKDNDRIELKIGSNLMKKNYETIFMDAVAEMKTIGTGGRTMLPISWLARALDVEYEWNGFSQRATFYPQALSGKTYSSAGTYGPSSGREVVSDNVIVKSSGVRLRNLHILGDLLIAESVGSGYVYLDNCTVEGKTLIQGGGKNSLHIDGGKYVGKIIIEKTPSGGTRVIAQNAEGVELEIAASIYSEEIVLEGSFQAVEIKGSNSIISTVGVTTIEDLVVSARSSLLLSSGTTVEAFTANSPAEVFGTGLIQLAFVNSSGVTLPREPQFLYSDSSTGIPSIIPENSNRTPNYSSTASSSSTPVINSYYPANGADNVDTLTSLTMYFNRDISAVSGKYIYIKKLSDNSTVQTIAADNSSYVRISGSNVTVILPTELSTSTEYYITVDYGAFRNSSDSSYFYSGISTTSTWRFTTSSTPSTGITVSSFSPAQGTTGVATTANLIINFNKNIFAVSGKNIYIYQVSNSALVETISAVSTKVAVSGNIVTINPDTTLANGTPYYVVIESGAFQEAGGVQTYAGVSGSSGWTFTTVSSTTPLTAIGTISGTPQPGEELTAGVLDPEGATVTYRWQYRVGGAGDWLNIDDATSATYTVADPVEVGDTVRVQVTGTDSYTGTIESDPVTIVAP